MSSQPGILASEDLRQINALGDENPKKKKKKKVTRMGQNQRERKKITAKDHDSQHHVMPQKTSLATMLDLLIEEKV